MTFKPYIPDMGSKEAPHHASNNEPETFHDAVTQTSHMVTMSGFRLDQISMALSRVGMNQLAQEIQNEVDDLLWIKRMLSSAYHQHINETVKDAEINSKTIVEAALVGEQLYREQQDS